MNILTDPISIQALTSCASAVQQTNVYHSVVIRMQLVALSHLCWVSQQCIVRLQDEC